VTTQERNKIGFETRREMPPKLRQMIQEIKHWQEFEPDPVYRQLAERIMDDANRIIMTIDHYESVSRSFEKHEN